MPGVTRAEFVVNQAGITRLLRRFFWDQHHQHSHGAVISGGMRNSQRQSSWADHPRAEGKPGQNKRRKVVDGKLAGLDHKPENAGERPAFGAVEPGGVDFDHARRAERLKIAVQQPDERKGREGPGERGEAVNEIERNRPQRADEHGRAAADAVGQQAIEQLAEAVGDRPAAENAGDLERVEMKFRPPCPARRNGNYSGTCNTTHT